MPARGATLGERRLAAKRRQEIEAYLLDHPEERAKLDAVQARRAALLLARDERRKIARDAKVAAREAAKALKPVRPKPEPKPKRTKKTAPDPDAPKRGPKPDPNSKAGIARREAEERKALRAATRKIERAQIRREKAAAHARLMRQKARDQQAAEEAAAERLKAEALAEEARIREERGLEEESPRQPIADNEGDLDPKFTPVRDGKKLPLPPDVWTPNPGQKKAIKLLTGRQRHTLIYGGARSGKTTLLLIAIVTRCLLAAGSRHVIVRSTFSEVKRSVWVDTFYKVMRTKFKGVTFRENKQDQFVEFANKSTIWFIGLDKKERAEKILGMEFCTIFCNECSQIAYPSVMLALTRLAQVCFKANGEVLPQRAYYDLNPAGTQHWTYLMFVLKMDPLDKRRVLDEPDDYQYTTINPSQNVANLDPKFLQSLERMPPRYRARFFEGTYQKEIDGQLWTIEALAKARCQPEDVPPGYKRIVVAVDPSGADGSEEKRSDAIGIVVAGLGYDDIAYVLEDATMTGGPADWSRVVIRLYDRWNADRIVAESNFGGELVRYTIKTRDRLANVHLVRASKGKVVRAEPVSTLYFAPLENVRHVGEFPELEEELLNFSTAGYQGSRSPNRADALVWALSDLMVQGRPHWATERPPQPRSIPIFAR
jgi:phage terminase large subunit-like protein